MPFIIALLILIILLLIVGPIVLVILAILGISVVAVIAWVVSKLFWIVLSAFGIGCLLTLVMYLINPEGMKQAMKDAESDQNRRDAAKLGTKIRAKKRR